MFMFEVGFLFILFSDISEKRIDKEVVSISVEGDEMMNFLKIDVFFYVVEKFELKLIILVVFFELLKEQSFILSYVIAI